MFDDDSSGYRRKKQKVELQVVPILDMFTAIIFFLLLSITFIQFTKHALPPSGVTTITDPQRPPPLQPKLYVTNKGSSLRILMTWSGAEPGSMSAIAAGSNVDQYPEPLSRKVEDIVRSFMRRFPAETTLQVGLGNNVRYQNLITVMDSAAKFLPDIVLVSYAEADSISSQME